MTINPRVKAAAQAFVLCLILGLTGCENGNLFGSLNERGDSNDVNVLNFEAESALREQDFNLALNLYERVLTIDPNNAEALYGASAAAVGKSGLNISVLLSNLTSLITSGVSGRDEVSFSNFHELVQDSRITISNVGNNTDSLLNGVALGPLNDIIDQAICRLQKIVAGATNGTISQNDIDVLLNVGSLCAIRAVLRPLREGWLDIRNVNGNFDVEISSSVAVAFCTNPSADNLALIQNIARDVVSAYALFNKAVNLLNLGGNQIIAQLRDDIQEAAQEVLRSGAGQILPGVCLQFLTNSSSDTPPGLGLSESNFDDNPDNDAVFSDPGTC